MWDFQEKTFVHEIESHTNYVRAVRFTPDGTKLISGDKDGTMRVFEVDSGQPLLNVS